MNRRTSLQPKQIVMDEADALEFQLATINPIDKWQQLEFAMDHAVRYKQLPPCHRVNIVNNLDSDGHSTEANLKRFALGSSWALCTIRRLAMKPPEGHGLEEHQMPKANHLARTFAQPFPGRDIAQAMEEQRETGASSKRRKTVVEDGHIVFGSTDTVCNLADLFPVGTIAWGKFHTYPCWPGKIVAASRHELQVLFYGDGTKETIQDVTRVHAFRCPEFEQFAEAGRCQTDQRLRDAFKKGMQEACLAEHKQALQQPARDDREVR